MVLPANNLWRHVPRRSTSISGVALSLDLGNTKIGEPDVALGVKDQVLRLDIAMYYILGVDILQTQDDTRNKKLCI